MTTQVPGFEIGEPIHESGSRVVYEAVRNADGAEVVVKTLSAQYPLKQDVAELRREYEIARKLAGVEGVIRVHSLETFGYGNHAIVMEPFGVSLADLMAGRNGKGLPLDHFLEVAIGIAELAGRVHEQGVVHKDLVPRNVLMDTKTGALKLIDFGISSELKRERQGMTLSRRLEGSLPYISPEQTGRTNREVDYRSDYYTMGVTFFELLTGSLPFTARDPMEWVHRHISMPAPAPSEVNEVVPAPLSDIVLKLMSKNAEDRYQSTFSLVSDLRRCQQELKTSATIRPFELGRKDVSRTFEIPQKLYGRTREIERLKDCFQDVASGLTELCVVTGYSGVGKSAVVNELSTSIVRERGYFIQGKFDQFQRSTAYSALGRALRSLIRQFLCESKERLDRWRDSLSDALGSNGQLIVDLVPELALIIGEQPPVARLPPAEAQNRFQLVFVNLMKSIATANQPLVMFVDDLQWSDAPTLNLLQRLATVREMSHLLIICAYRSNQVDSGHPVSLMLDEVRRTKNIVEVLVPPLDVNAVRELTADTLQCEAQEARPLAEMLFEKAEGNPFFIKALMKNLHEQDAIHFDEAAGGWRWDMQAVARAETADNVVDFMVEGLRRLSEETQQVLQLAACIGNSFDLRTLAVIYGQPAGRTAESLLEALKRNIVIPLSDSYKFVDAETGDGQSAPNPTYRFQHDRVQQAAYALIDADRKQAVHLSVGRLIQQHLGSEALDERLMDVVGHLNRGRRLIDDARDRRALADLNLRAAVKAAGSSAYEAALELLKVAQELLPEDSWGAEYELTKAIGIEYQQCAYLTGQFEEADRWIDSMLQRVPTDLEKAKLLSQRTRQYATIGKMRESISAAIAGLKLVSVDITERPSKETVERETALVQKNLRGRAIAELIDAEQMTDARQLVAVRLLMEIFPAAFLSGSGDLFPYLVLKAVNISLMYGNSPESAFAYAACGMLLCGALDDPALGYEYGKLAVAMNDRFDDIKLKSRVIYVYTMFVHHWSNHWSTMTPWFNKGIEAGYQSGDLLYLAYSAQDCIIWDPKLDLETASNMQRKYLTIVRDCEYQDSLDSGTLFLQMLLNFRGLTDGLDSLSNDSFDEDACVSGMRERGFITGIANFHIYKAEICFLYEDYEKAHEHIEQQDRIVASSMSLPQLVRFRMVSFLTGAARYASLTEPQRKVARKRLESEQRQMARWAENCRDNFAHLSSLMLAELARLFGSMEEALRYYEDAIREARAAGFLRDEAMASELAGKYLLGARLSKPAEAYFSAACYLYDRWGAARKVKHLKSTYPQVAHAAVAAASSMPVAGPTHRGTTSTAVHQSLDMVSVIKASQAISGEMVPERLWKKTLQILLENAGGQRGYLVLRHQGRLVIEAQGEAGVDAPAMRGRVDVETGQAMLPVTVLNNALRTGKAVVLNAASEAGRFANDPYLLKHQPQSLICVPISHGQFEAALYMENGVTRGAFTEDRVEIIKLLSAQAAISIENARLYEEQLRLTKAQRRFVPSQFLENLGHHDIARVDLGESVAREMTVMFCDLREFTPLVERLGPAAVIKLLNGYFSSVGAPIAEEGGFIDSYNGDEIMALFGTHPDRAVRAGLAMWRELEQFNERSVASGNPELVMGVGMATGELVLGTVGSPERLKCGVVGDTVNLASRVEQLTKRYDARFLISEQTYDGLSQAHPFSIRQVDRVAVKGKQEAVVLYEVLDAERPARKAMKGSTRELLAGAMGRYYGRDFRGALKLFERVAAADQRDPVPRIFSERCRRYMRDEPAKDWGGFETLRQKA